MLGVPPQWSPARQCLFQLIAPMARHHHLTRRRQIRRAGQQNAPASASRRWGATPCGCRFSCGSHCPRQGQRRRAVSEYLSYRPHASKSLQIPYGHGNDINHAQFSF
jgi:hypothetical protein